MQPHILAIDDEEDIREMLQQLLTFKGYRVSVAANADQARRVVQADPPHLIISDLQMEDTDGLVLVEELHQKLPEVPILLLTGVVFDPEVVRENLRKKVTSYLDKTTSLEGIVAEIRRLLGEGKAGPAAETPVRPAARST